VASIKTDVSDEHIIPIIRMRRISEPWTMLAVTGNYSTIQRNMFLWSMGSWATYHHIPEDIIHFPITSLNQYVVGGFFLEPCGCSYWTATYSLINPIMASSPMTTTATALFAHTLEHPQH
jgi:hypothetical protein